jgi:hypothetical protein
MKMKARTAQCNRHNADANFIAGKNGPEADSAARSLIHPTMARARRQPERRANLAFTLRGEKGLRGSSGFVKGGA